MDQRVWIQIVCDNWPLSDPAHRAGGLRLAGGAQLHSSWGGGPCWPPDGTCSGRLAGDSHRLQHSQEACSSGARPASLAVTQLAGRCAAPSACPSRRWLILAVRGSLTPWKPANAVRQGSSSSRRAGCRTFTSPSLCPAIHLPPVSPFPGQPSIPSSRHREMDPSGKGPVEPGRCRASADRRTRRPRQNPARVCGFFLHLFTAISFRPKWM